MFSRFDTTPACDRQTSCDSTVRSARTSRDKNCSLTIYLQTTVTNGILCALKQRWAFFVVFLMPKKLLANTTLRLLLCLFVCLSICQSLTLYSPEAIIVATSNNMELVHWPLMGGLLHLVHRYTKEGTGRGPSPPRPLPRCTKCNSPPINGQCTNHRIAV